MNGSSANRESYPQDVDMSSSSDFATRWRRLMPYILGGAGVLLMLGGFMINYYKSHQETTAGKKTAGGQVTRAEAAATKTVKVDVSGAVERPGVYELPNDSRVEDVLIAAGGLGAKADRIYVSKTINLAQRVTDGMKIYIPEIGSANSSNLSSSTNLSDLININSATNAELDSLPGVGPATAAKIVAGRPYQSVSELIGRKIVGQSVYEKIKDMVAVY